MVAAKSPTKSPAKSRRPVVPAPSPVPIAINEFQWRAFAPFALLRVLCAVCALAMIHPDEFFQSQEVMARDLLMKTDPALATQLHAPWEFALPSPNRSVLVPYLVAGLPYKLFEWLGIPLNGYILLVVPRLVLCALSFIVDAVLFHCAKTMGVHDPMKVVLSFASSWPALIFLTRPFSNTFETLVLALCMLTLQCYNLHVRVFCNILHIQTLLLGSLLAIGFFTRFTFPFFFLPLGLELVRRQDELLVHEFKKKHDPPVEHIEKRSPLTLPGKKEPWEYTKTTGAMDAERRKALARELLLRRIARAISIGIQGLLSFVFWSTAIVALDTWYFHGEFPVTIDAWKNAAIAPFNNLKYNLDPANLELHGMHPRVTHALVNMPMLFGPLFVIFLVNLKTAKQRIWKVSCVLVPLTLISLAPHQEPRFLLPLVVPLHLFHGACVMDTRWKHIVWGIFSALLAIFFGLLHQGGLLPLLLSLGSGASSPLLALPFTGCRFVDEFISDNNMPLVFYKTYMPPRFALANDIKPWGRDFRVVDLAGGDAMHSQLYDVTSYSKFLLVAPASVEITNVLDVIGTNTADGTLPIVGTCFPHVSTEDLAWDKPFELVIYRWTKPPSFVSRLWEATTSVFSSQP